MAEVLGVVADDVTGACDVAGRVADAGLPAVVHLGAAPAEPDGAACSVVALKVRTAEPVLAASAAAEAAAGLLRVGADTVYQKYCSTFDSTERGNIGPIADALAAVVARSGPRAATVGTPATPGAGRVQLGGRLLVHGVPLADTPMRHHPLTPMRDSDLVRVLQSQTGRTVGLIRIDVVRRGVAALRRAVARAEQDGAAHLLVDAESEGDLDVLAAAMDGGSRLLGGAAGLATAIARRAARGAFARRPSTVPLRGRLLLAGSASARTREQVAAFRGPVVAVDPLVLATDGDAPLLEAVDRAARSAEGVPVLVSSTATPDRVRAAQAVLGVAPSAALIEHALATVAARLVGAGRVSHLIVAGGETSGAVVAALGLRTLAVGASAAPGVPWMTAAGPVGPLALLLKSGGFGDADLFETAWRSAP